MPKTNEKKLNNLTIGLIGAGALLLIFGPEAEPIECEPENVRWVGGPLGAVGETCDNGISYER